MMLFYTPAEFIRTSEEFFSHGSQILLNMAVPDFPFGILAGFVVIFLLLISSALVSGAEVAFFSLKPLQINHLRTSGSKNGKRILRLLEKPRMLLATILIANNFINITIVILSTFLLHKLGFADQNPVVAYILEVFVVAGLILLVGEVTPKMFASRKALLFANFMVRPVRFMVGVFYPLSYILVKSTSFIDKRISSREYSISMTDLSKAIDITTNDNTPEDERKILKGIIRFGDTEVKEIMRSRVDITAVSADLGFRELVGLITESGYSRIPVYRETFDNILGILHVKDLLPYLGEKANFDWTTLTRPAFYIPENKKISDLLQEFRDKKIHLAVIVDEYGGTSGIVTMEDIIEEIVGEISDEFDTPDDDIKYRKIDENTWIFEGKTSIHDFCRLLSLPDNHFDKVKGESETLAGLILETAGKIPEKGTVMEFTGFTFTILNIDYRRIKTVRVFRHQNPIE